MSKLTKPQIKAHKDAERLLEKDALSIEEREFVLEHWDPSALHINSAAGAFFTPVELAYSFAAMLGHPGSILDLCAGIGVLGFAALPVYRHDKPRIVCIEKNPDYVRVGRKVLPEATWIEADVFDVPSMDIGSFDVAIGNPPYGRIAKTGRSAAGVKGDFEFHVISIGMGLAEWGQFILPQMSAGFNYSGAPCYQRQTFGRGFDFQRQHGFHFECASIDTTFAKTLWKGTAPTTEIVTVERSQAESAALPFAISRASVMQMRREG